MTNVIGLWTHDRQTGGLLTGPEASLQTGPRIASTHAVAEVTLVVNTLTELESLDHQFAVVKVPEAGASDLLTSPQLTGPGVLRHAEDAAAASQPDAVLSC